MDGFKKNSVEFCVDAFRRATEVMVPEPIVVDDTATAAESPVESPQAVQIATPTVESEPEEPLVSEQVQDFIKFCENELAEGDYSPALGRKLQGIIDQLQRGPQEGENETYKFVEDKLADREAGRRRSTIIQQAGIFPHSSFLDQLLAKYLLGTEVDMAKCHSRRCSMAEGFKKFHEMKRKRSRSQSLSVNFTQHPDSAVITPLRRASVSQLTALFEAGTPKTELDCASLAYCRSTASARAQGKQALARRPTAPLSPESSPEPQLRPMSVAEHSSRLQAQEQRDALAAKSCDKAGVSKQRKTIVTKSGRRKSKGLGKRRKSKRGASIKVTVEVKTVGKTQKKRRRKSKRGKSSRKS